jgi:hypothetical protein
MLKDIIFKIVVIFLLVSYGCSPTIATVVYETIIFPRFLQKISLPIIIVLLTFFLWN